MDWTAEVVARMHMAHITRQELADGYQKRSGPRGCSATYISLVLHGKKGKGESTKNRILQALSRLEEKKALGGSETAGC